MARIGCGASTGFCTPAPTAPSPQFFFLFLLPPIIFESAISMDPGPFFRNFGAISYFAFAGTFGAPRGLCIPQQHACAWLLTLSYSTFLLCSFAVSALFVGGFVYLMGVWHICFPLTLVESLLFGALISANDPVTVLAIFNQLGCVQRLDYACVTWARAHVTRVTHPPRPAAPRSVNENLYALVFGESVLNDAVALVLYRAFKRFLDVVRHVS